MSTTLYDDPGQGIRISLDTAPDDDFAAMLRNTVWGTSGVMYRSPEVEAHEFDHPAYRTIRCERHGRLIGTYLLVHKRVRVGATSVNAYHRTMLSIDPAHGGNRYGQLMVREVKRHFLDQASEPTLLYGYVESENHRSMTAVGKAGFESLGTIGIISFSRHFPKERLSVERLANTQRGELVEQIRTRYDDHLLLDVEQSLDPRRTFVVKQGHRIRAAVFALPHRIQLVDLPDRAGRFLIRHGHRIPVLGRVFGLRDMRQVWFGALYADEGDEAILLPLMETVLAQEGAFSGSIYLDRRSPWYARMLDVGRLGWLHTLGGVQTAEIMGAFHGVPAQDLQSIEGRPLWISPLEPF